MPSSIFDIPVFVTVSGIAVYKDEIKILKNHCAKCPDRSDCELAGDSIETRIDDCDLLVECLLS